MWRLQKRKTLFIEDLLLRGGPSGRKSWVSGFWKPKPITNKTQTNLNIIQYMWETFWHCDSRVHELKFKKFSNMTENFSQHLQILSTTWNKSKGCPPNMTSWKIGLGILDFLGTFFIFFKKKTFSITCICMYYNNNNSIVFWIPEKALYIVRKSVDHYFR